MPTSSTRIAEKYAEVILPLPIAGTFTYGIPAEMAPLLQRGCRVLVQFGRRKYYTGIIADIHPHPPKDYEVKPLMALLDPQPVIRFPQLKFWEWISGYYLCSTGEVMKAALPAGLKVESETFVSLNEDFDKGDADVKFSETQAIIIMALTEKKRLRVSELEKATGIANLGHAINRLLEIGAIEIDERAVEHYRPHTETMVAVCAERNDNDTLHSFFDLVGRSARQERLLVAYLEMSGWMRVDEPLRDVEKKRLIEATGSTPAIFKALADKGILRTYKKTVNRFNTGTASVTAPAVLSPAQNKAFREIGSAFRSNATVLLHGIT